MPDINVDSLLSVLKFTTTILLPKYPHSIFPLLSTYYIARHRREKKTLKLELWSVPEDAFACLIPESAKPILLGNVDSSILVSFNTLQTLGVNSCSWLKLKKCPEEIGAFDTTRSYLAYIIAIPDIEDSVAVVTNVLHYNITQALLLVNNIVQAEKLDGFELFVPHIATLAKVSLLQPLYDVNIALDAVLSCYFQHPCFLRKGDVFCIDLIKFASAVPCLNSKVRTLCFKVLDIEGPCYGGRVNQGLTHGYYVMKLFTSLVQCTDQQGYVPQSDVAFIKGKGKITGNNLKLQLLSTCPAGLDEYRDELLGCVQPHVLNMYRFKLKPLFLLCGPRGVGKVVVARNVAQRLGLNVFVVNSFELQGGNPGYTEGKLKHVFTKVQQLAPCILLLRNIEVLCRDKDGTEDSRAISAFINEVERLFQETSTLPVLLVATCNSKNESTSAVPPALARVFLHVVYMQSPNKLQRTAILQWLLRKCNVTVGADLSHVADQTSGFLYADLAVLVFHTVRYRFKHLKESCHDEQNCVDVTLRKADFEEALDTMHAAYSEAIDAPKIPKVSWDDVGGLSDVKKEIMRTIMLPLQHPELLAAGLQRSGILLYGPPGTGKTLLAKAVATEFNLNFLSVKGPELLNMYVGQSEENVREDLTNFCMWGFLRIKSHSSV
ncbi:peroxisome assembly factor 2 isoform X2 [Zootermopsis nevadensis]|uniref:peroxisome assembly factor 2 isoform X2 n=1 Tax=Zootermopsis nevadensis TaxID=136037 RepID=UPI000B8E4E54|nr:peroxisome assembly factor 2 isoform X2 [Zootermopsis nevadensis]